MGLQHNIDPTMASEVDPVQCHYSYTTATSRRRLKPPWKQF